MRSRTLTFCAILTLLFVTAGVQTASAQDKRLTCESTGSSYEYCRADTDNNVKLEKQLSFSQCVYNSSWGYDNRGIWVDRGCRAEFSYGKSGNGAAIAAGAIIGGAILAGVLAANAGSNDKINNENDAYSYGYNNGRNDALAGRSSKEGQKDNHVDSNYRTEFNRGYHNGYAAGLSSNNNNNNGYNYGTGNSTQQRQAYQAGYNRGESDAGAHRIDNYRRYSREYNNQTENSYRNGYSAGYSHGNSWGNNNSNTSSRVPNWLIGKWRTRKGSTTIDLTFYSSGDITVDSRTGRQDQRAAGYYRNGNMSIPNFATYDIRRSGNSFQSINIRDRNDVSTYTRIY
jgi:hypothetical protein